MGVGPAAGRLGEKIIVVTLSPLLEVSSMAASELFKLARHGWRNLSEKQAKKRFANYIASLENRGLIEKSGRGMSSTVSLTPKGYQRLEYLSMKKLKLPDGQKWDGFWHLASFDIPETDRLARNAIRRLLTELGCQYLHHSVWIHPLDFTQQIQEIQKLYGIRKHITIFKVASFDRQEEYKRRFKNVINL